MEHSVVKSVDILLKDNLIRNLKKKLSKSENQRLPGACNRSPGSKLLSIATQLPDTILEEDHPITIPSKFGSN